MKDFEDNFISGSINDPDEDIYESIEKEKEEKKKQEEELRKESEKTEKKMKEDEDVMYRSENLEERFDDGMEPGNKRMAQDDINKYIIYIQAKTGQDKIEKSVREKIDTVAKAAAAYMLLKADNTKEFSESLINKNATKVKQTLDLANMHEIELNDMLRDSQGVRVGVNTRLRDLYGRPQDLAGYVKEMKQLYDSLMTSDNRTAEYKNMVNSIKAVSELDPNNAMLTEDDIISKNYKAMESIEKYMKGKKRVRKTDVGVEHFNNAVDGLSIMAKYNPMLADKAQAIEDRINEVRGSEAENHKDHISLADFGAERAIKAKEVRIEKAKEKKREITMDKSKYKQKEMTHPHI